MMTERATTIHDPDPEVPFSFALDLDYAAIVAVSERVAWSVDRVFRYRAFDPTRPIVPANWLGSAGLEFVDEAFAAQAACEVETLARVRGRALDAAEAERLHAALHDSLARITAGVGLPHATFVRVAQDPSPEGAARLGIGGA